MKTSKKLLSILLSVIMVLTVVPLAALPAGAEGDPYVTYVGTQKYVYDKDTKALSVINTDTDPTNTDTFLIEDLELFYNAYSETTNNLYAYSPRMYKYSYVEGFRSFIHGVKSLTISGFDSVRVKEKYYLGGKDGSNYSTYTNEFHLSFRSFINVTSVLLEDNARLYHDISYAGDFGFSDYGHNKNWTLTIKGETSIDEYFFHGDEKLTSVTFSGDGAKAIGQHAFYDCKNLKNVDLTGVTSIGPVAFEGCEKLQSIVIPSTVTEMGYNVFDGCSALTSADLSCETVGAAAFADTPLSSLVLRSGVKKINSWAFSGTQIGGAVTIPSTVTEIGSCAFLG